MTRYHTNKNGNTAFSEAEEEEADAAKIADEELVAANAYKYARRLSFLTINDQLDQLFHDMTNGKGDKSGDWYKAVAKVRSDNPKPE